MPHAVSGASPVGRLAAATSATSVTLAVVLASDVDNRNGKVASVTTANAYDVTDGARAYDLDSHTLRWDNSGEDGLIEITVARSGVGYGPEGGVSVAVDLSSGQRLERGDRPVAVAVSDAGALVTALPQDPGSGPTDRTAGAGPGYVVHFAR